MQFRYFNEFKISVDKKSIIKSSWYKQKFINEINWFFLLPEKLRKYCPKIFDHSLTFEPPFIKMEYLFDYKNLSDFLDFKNMSESENEKISSLIKACFFDFKTTEKKVDHSAIISEQLKAIYFDKTISRLNEAKESIELNHLFEKELIINSKKYKSLNFYLEKLDQILMENKIYKLDYIQVIHGDFCANNIMLNEKCDEIKLIDPRGSFFNLYNDKSLTIYGDHRYEYAKMLHSIDGKYDKIIKDEFSLKISNNEIEYSVKNFNNKSLVEKIYSLFVNCEIDQIKLIEALLFLSMLPLHKDNFERQIIFLATGIELIDKFYKK